MDDLISRQAAIDAVCSVCEVETPKTCSTIQNGARWCFEVYNLLNLPSAQSEEVIPHRNYKYLSDYWCECGWHLGKKGEVKYCSECGRKVNWDE